MSEQQFDFWIKKSEHDTKLNEAWLDGIFYGVAGTIFVLFITVPLLIVYYIP